jgi:diguanylate cyclase
MLRTSYDPFLVVCSFVLAMLASYTALSMVPRIRGADDRLRATWLLGTSVAQTVPDRRS